MPLIHIPLFCLCLALTVQPTFAGFDEAAAAFAVGNYDKALEEVRPLAEQGDPRGQYAMGVLYENGFAVARDLPQAAAWYLKAAEQGNSDAQYNLGAMYEHGVGIPVNFPEAARWYRPAAEQGDIDALSNLGVLYQSGQGVPQDKVLALALYNVSVAYAGEPQDPGGAEPPGLGQPDAAGRCREGPGTHRRVA